MKKSFIHFRAFSCISWFISSSYKIPANEEREPRKSSGASGHEKTRKKKRTIQLILINYFKEISRRAHRVRGDKMEFYL